MGVRRILKKGALYLTAAFTLAIGGDAGVRQLVQKKSPLIPADIEFAQEYYGNTIDYSKVRTVDGRFSFLQPPSTIVTLGSTVYIPKSAPMDAEIFMHEMMHVWQSQNNVENSGPLGALRLALQHGSYSVDDAHGCYAYVADSTKKLTDYNMEQQAEIMGHYVRLRHMTEPDSVTKDSITYNQKMLLREKIITTAIPVTRAAPKGYPSRKNS